VPLRLLWLGALAATPVLTLWLIARHGVNVPLADDWSLVPLFEKRDAGTLTLGDLLAQHHEHVPVIPRAADLFMAPLTDWNLRVEMFRNFGVAVVTFGVILLALRRALAGPAFVLCSVVASLLFFSPAQWENWIWGWQLEWFLSNLGALVAFYALAYVVDGRPRGGLALAALGALVATFSLGQGLLVWPVGLVILLLRRRPWRAWAGVGTLTYVLYFVDWENPAELGDKTTFLDQPGDSLDFLLLYLGRALGSSDATGRVAAVVVFAAFAAAALAVLRRRDPDLLQRAAVWLALGLYAIGSAVITVVARVDQHFFTSRYTVMTALFAIATMTLVYVAAPRGRPAVLAVVAAPLLVGGAINVRDGADGLRTRAAAHEAFARCLRENASPYDPCARPASLNPQVLRGELVRFWPRVAYLRRKGWAGF
jgi:hypothetical protein